MTAVRQDVGTNAAAPFVAGDDRVLRFVATEDDNTTPIDLTGYNVRWELFAWSSGPKYGVPDTTPTVVKSSSVGGITVTDPAGGIVEVALAAQDTANLVPAGQTTAMHWHELQVTDATGKIITGATGHFLITFQRVV
jgi:hypothetical protein